MKKILFSLTILLSGCNADHSPVIVGKNFNNDNQKCICDYWYTGLGRYGGELFEDSCSKYNIGDTIK